MIKWIVQNNLIKPEVLEQFRGAFQALAVDFEEVLVVPFSPDLPAFTPADINVFYGSTTLMLNAYNSPYSAGVFYDPTQFNTESYLQHWSAHMLNADGKVQPFDAFIATRMLEHYEWFIRPNSDDKIMKTAVRFGIGFVVTDIFCRIKFLKVSC